MKLNISNSNNKVNKILSDYVDRVEPENIESGVNWYRNAYKWCREIAYEIGVSTEMVAKVVAILSPFNVWENNKMDAYKLLFALKYERETVGLLTFTTFRNNVQKAIDVYDGKVDFVLTDTNMKTYSFYQNLILNKNYVTIDRWMMRIIDFEKYFGKTLTQKRYKQFAESIMYVAMQKGLKGYELQAILWEQIRNEN